MPSTPTNVSASDGAYRDGILVTWSYPGNVSEVGRWDIYRWKDSETPKFYYSVFGNTLQYADLVNVFGFSQDVTAKYNYAVRAYSYTAGSSELSQADSGFVAPNNAPTFSLSSLSVSTNEDQSKQIALIAGDKDGDTLAYTISKSASNGSVNISGSSVTYRPKENFNGSDTFTVKVSDAWGGYSTQVIDVTVNPVNDNPIFLSSLITQNNKFVANASGSTIFKVLAFDIDGDRGTFSVGNAAYGQVSISGNTITYSTNGNSIKSDSFEVAVSDGNGGVAKQKIDVVIGTPATPSSSLLPKSGSDTIDMMLNGYRWYGNTIYYSLSVGADGSSIPSDPVKFEQDLKFIFEAAFGLYLDVQFVFVGFFESPEYAYYSGSNINIALDRTNFSSTNILGKANFPVLDTPLSTFPSSYRGSEGDVFININGPANTLTYAPGTEGFLLLLHEIGHALGLKHPHDDGGSGRPTFSDLKLNDLNIDWWTIMSYDDDSSSIYYWDPTTPMVLDVIALQYLYGASNNASGNNSYDLRFNVPAYFTIFDSAGSDILDFRNAAEAVYAELPTLWISSFQEYPIGIALPLSDLYRSAPTYLTWLYGDFEEIQGSSYSDVIIGSQNADKIFGNSGNDTIRGGRGSDTIDGGYGTDTVFFADLFSECTVTFDGDQCVVTTRTEGTDRLANVEKLSFGPTGSSVEYSVASLKNHNPAFAPSAQSISTDEDKAKTITVSATDADGDSLTYTVSRTPTNGTTNISGSTVTYTPAKDYNGTDSFVVTASDGKGGTATQTINMTVTPVNDAPTFAAALQAVSATAGTAKTITLLATDVDGDGLTYTVATPGKGTASISGSTLTYTPASTASGSDSFVVTASDGKGGTATQTINATVLVATAAKAFTVNTLPGWVGSVGGNGSISGSNGFEDVRVLYGQIALDGSFNRGGDIVRVSGNADSYLIGRTSASSAYIEAGTATKLTIPIGSTGMGIVYDDGVRKLSFSSGAYKIGNQTFSAEPTKITSAADGTVLPTGADPAAQAIVSLLSAGLSGGKTPDLTISGKVRIAGTNGVDVIKVGSTGGDLTFDGSFNRGGDIIILNKAAGDYSAAKFNASTIVISSGIEKLIIPMGSAGLTLRFTDGDRTLVFKNAAFNIGEQIISSATATPLTPSTITLSADQGVAGSSAILDATGKVVITDDATKTSNVILKNFGTDDVIRVTGATASQYNFAISALDPKDLEITYTDAATSATNTIVLDDVIKADAFIADYATASTAIGWNFMTFG